MRSLTVRSSNRKMRLQNITRRTILFAALCACGILPEKFAAADTPVPDDIVYIETNDSAVGQNAILAYRRTADGTITALSGSPFPLGGTGGGASRDTDQNVMVSPDHTLLFAVNSGSGTVSVMRIQADGSLLPAPGSPFASGGITPVSVGIAGSRLYVVNTSGDSALGIPPNYTGFAINADGSLTPIPGSTQNTDYGDGPTQALTTPRGDFLFGADFSGSKLRAYRINPSGTLQQASNSPLAAPNPLGIMVHPTQPILYAGLPFRAQLGVYACDGTGTLTPVTTARNSGSAICWLAITRDGRNLYSTNTGSDSVSWYDLTNPLAPVERQNLHLKGGGGPYQVAANPSGSYLYVVNQTFGGGLKDNALHTFRIDAGGSLTEYGQPLSFPVGGSASPQGVAVIQPPARVTGNIVLADRSPLALPNPAVTLQFRPQDSSAAFTKQAILNPDGSFALTDIPPLRYTVQIKSSGHLAKTVTLDATQGSGSAGSVVLLGGDANNDNKVDIADFGLLVNAYGAAYDLSDPNAPAEVVAADFNGDGVVDIGDFGILVNNYNAAGAL